MHQPPAPAPAPTPTATSQPAVTWPVWCTSCGQQAADAAAPDLAAQLAAHDCPNDTND